MRIDGPRMLYRCQRRGRHRGRVAEARRCTGRRRRRSRWSIPPSRVHTCRTTGRCAWSVHFLAPADLHPTGKSSISASRQHQRNVIRSCGISAPTETSARIDLMGSECELETALVCGLGCRCLQAVTSRGCLRVMADTLSCTSASDSPYGCTDYRDSCPRTAPLGKAAVWTLT